MKRGVIDLADIVAVNKADGTNVGATDRARSEAQNALHYFPGSQSGWTPRALTCSAQTGKGIADLWTCVLEYTRLTKANGWFTHARQGQTQKWMQEIIRDGLKHQNLSLIPPSKNAWKSSSKKCSKDAPHLFAPRVNCLKPTPPQNLKMANPACARTTLLTY
jgi:LAO/AO transport system kinase